MVKAGETEAAGHVRDLLYRVQLGRLKRDASESDLFGLPEAALEVRAGLIEAMDSAAAELAESYDREIKRAGVDLALALQEERQKLLDGEYQPATADPPRGLVVGNCVSGGLRDGNVTPNQVFPLGLQGVPDCLSVSFSGQRATISGTGTASFTAVDGVTRKAFGKAVLFDSREASGLVVVERLTGTAHCNFVAVANSQCVARLDDLKPGKTYEWSVARDGRNLRVVVRDGLTVHAEASFPAVPWGFQAGARKGEQIDVTVAWE